MNTAQTNSYSWQLDLEASRDVSAGDRKGFGIVLSWFEKWRIRTGLEPGHPAARQFWRVQVMAKRREPWQLQQWTEAMRWYHHHPCGPKHESLRSEKSAG